VKTIWTKLTPIKREGTVTRISGRSMVARNLLFLSEAQAGSTTSFETKQSLGLVCLSSVNGGKRFIRSGRLNVASAPGGDVFEYAQGRGTAANNGAWLQLLRRTMYLFKLKNHMVSEIVMATGPNRWRLWFVGSFMAFWDLGSIFFYAAFLAAVATFF